MSETSPPDDLEFLARAVAPDGSSVAAYAEGTSAADAVQRLEAEGYTSVELFEDLPWPLVRRLNRQEGERRGEKLSPMLSADKAIVMQTAKPGALAEICERISRHPYSMVGWTAVFVVAFLTSASWWIIGALALVAVTVETIGASARAMGLYIGALEETYERRGGAALERIDQLEANLEKVQQLNLIGSLELAGRRANAFAVDGDLERAFAEIERSSIEAGAPKWLEHVRRASVHSAAFDFEGAVRENELALELAPPCTSILLDLALLYAVRLEDYERAQQMLTRAEALPMPVGLRAAFDVVACAVHLGRDEIAAADDALSRAESDDMLQTSWTHVWLKNIGGALRCLVDAAQGDIEDAKRTLDIFEPALTAAGELALLERCRAAVSRS